MKGKLIVFEGGEGSGKSTMVNKTYNYLKDKGVDCIKSREPGGTLFGNDIRDILFNKDYSCTLDEQTKLYLFEAARREHYLNIIKPALDAGKVVLLDRFVLSALVLQNTGNTNEIDMLNDLSTNYVKIDATIILDINPKIAIDRIKSNNRETNYNDEKPIEWHMKVRNMLIYLGMAIHKFNSHIVNAEKDKDEVFKDVIKIIEGVINKDE